MAFRPLAGTDGHFLAVVRRPGKRRIDLSGRGHGDARDDCQIAALYAVARELGGEAFMRGIGLGDDEQARGVLVDPMDDAGPGDAAAARTPARAMVAQGAEQRAIQITARREDPQYRRLAKPQKAEYLEQHQHLKESG